jgi:GT2 family glycosyltransferase
MKVYGAIATMPSRLPYLEKCIDSLLPQVDTLFVYFNNFSQLKDPPGFLKKVELITGEDIGSGAKFFKCSEINGYYATCDDDLIFPPDYIKRLKDKVELYKRSSVVTFHGRIINQPIESYIGCGPRRAKIIYRCLEDVSVDHEVHIGGTGVMMLHTDTLRVNMSNMPNRNMDDVDFSIHAQKSGIPIIVSAHAKGWIKYLLPPEEDTIWKRMKKNEAPIVNLVNSYQWREIHVADS